MKLGTTQINKVYLGATEAKKLYLGTNLIYDNSSIDTVVTIDTTSSSATWTPTNIVNSGATLTWEVTGGVVIAPQVIDKPILNLSSNTGTANITITSSTAFVGFTELWFNNGTTSLEVTSIDISEATALTKIDLFNNNLTTIDISANTALVNPWVQSNTLTAFDPSTNVLAEFIAVDTNSLTALDISANVLLTDLWAYDNLLTTAELDAIINDLDTNGLSNGVVKLAGNTGLPLTAASGTAYDALVGKGWTIDVAKYTPVDTTDPVIGTLAYANESDTTVELSMSVASTDNIAVVEHWIYKDFVFEKIITGATFSGHEITGLTASTNYDFTCVAYDAAGNFSLTSNIVNFTTDATPTPPATDDLRPVISNFRVENAQSGRLYFDSSEIITASTGVNGYTGFTITDKVISQITINSGSLKNHYFDVTVDFDFYSNNTIRYSTGSDLSDSESNELYPFDLQNIVNNIVQPSTSSTYYVTTGGGTGAGTEGDPWSLSHALSTAANDDLVYIQKGDYGTGNFVVSNSGTLANPIIFEGYDTTPGDAPSLAWDVDLDFDDTVMPLISSTSSSGSGLSLGGNDYIIIKNIQVEGYEYTINFGGQSEYVILDNVYAKDSLTYTIMGFYTAMIGCRVINSFIGKSDAHGIRLAGNKHLMDNCYVSSTDGIHQDYFVSIYAAASGNGEHIIRNLTIIRDTTSLHWGHGISLRQGGVGRAIQNTLVEDCYIEAVGSAALELRSEGVEYCVIRNIEVNNLNLTSGTFNAMRITSAQNNIIDGLVAYDCEIFIRFYASDEEQSSIDATDSGNNNLFKNCVFYNNLTANDNWAIVNFEDKTYPSTSRVPKNNTFANCTFHHIDTSVQNPNGTQGVDNEFINCIFNDVDNRSDNWEYTYSNFYTTFPTPSGAGNVSTKPNFTAVDNGGFDLSDNTPAIVYNGGTDVGVYYDIKGQERKTSFSMGAYEWNEGEPFFTKQYNESIYSESILIEPYDSGNSAHKLISTVGDWSDINSGTITHFYVEPGDYFAAGDNVQRITLSASGTSSAKRYISLYNGNDTHPASLTISTANLARAGFEIEGDYWVIDRMADWDRAGTQWTNRINGGSNNIINRYLQDEMEAPCVYIYDDSHSNLIQNCRTQKTNPLLFADRAMFGLEDNGVDGVTMKNNKFIQNEIVNSIDGFQSVKSTTTWENQNGEGTVIDANHIYITTALYTDGAGNLDPNGAYAFSENAIDLKFGSLNAANPMIVTNNYMAGFRESDTTGTSLSSSGDIMRAHNGVENLICNNNLIIDGNRGVSVSGSYYGYAAKDCKFNNNIITEILGQAILLWDSTDLEIDGNLLKDVSSSFGVSITFNNANGYDYLNNLVVDSARNTQNLTPISVTITDNGYYNAPNTNITDASDTFYGSDPTVNYNDINLTTDRFTNSPQTITAQKVQK